MSKVLNEFKTFIMRGNVVDMAVGLSVGVAFTTVVKSLVDDIIMPPIGVLVGQVGFSQLFISLSGEHFATLRAAQDAGAATMNVGLFINALINFLIVGIVIFFLIKALNRIEPPPPPPATKDCPFCLSKVPDQATRCPYCTSQLEPSEL